MKVPIAIICLALSALLAAQAWTLREVVSLKVAVATLTERLNHGHIAATRP